MMDFWGSLLGTILILPLLLVIAISITNFFCIYNHGPKFQDFKNFAISPQTFLSEKNGAL